jgi:hypothetical protein
MTAEGTVGAPTCFSSKVTHVRGRKKSRDVIQITSRLYHIIMVFMLRDKRTPQPLGQNFLQLPRSQDAVMLAGIS